MKRHSRSTNYRWLPTGLAGAGLAAAALLGTTALLVARRARRAERDTPPVGHFLDIEGVHLHYSSAAKDRLSSCCTATAPCCRILRSAGYLRGWPNDTVSSLWIDLALVIRAGQGLKCGHQKLRLISCTGRSLSLTSNKRSWSDIPGEHWWRSHLRSITQPTCEAWSCFQATIFRPSALTCSHPWQRGPRHWRSAELHGRPDTWPCPEISGVSKAFCARCRTVSL